jgi:hypothetical protein
MKKIIIPQDPAAWGSGCTENEARRFIRQVTEAAILAEFRRDGYESGYVGSKERWIYDNHEKEEETPDWFETFMGFAGRPYVVKHFADWLCKSSRESK